MWARDATVLLTAWVILAPALGAAPPRPTGEPAKTWTEEQILAAEPMPLPVDARGRIGRRQSGAAAPALGPRFDSRPSAPRVAVGTSRARYVASPARLRSAWSHAAPHSRRAGGGDGPTALNRGTAGFNFSSSRLVPDDAGAAYPYSTVGVLLFRRPGVGAFRCSASVVSRRVIATAGHCVYSAPGGFATDFLFIPAFHEGLAPFGTWDGVEAFAAEEWRASPEVPNAGDLAVVVLADSDGTAVGDLTGWLGFKARGLENNHVKMLGYPGNHDGGRRMHQVDSGDWLLLEDPVAVLYGSDMRGGSSGGPWVQNFGIKAKGQRGGKNRAPNRIVGITSALFEDQRLLLLESSILGPTFKAIFDQACAQAAGNCSRRGKPKD